ncbi:MAG TPA: nitrile hydratase subunit beta [Xanthobacteraceae bacterium]|jgi:nitrile hydratase
MNGVHDMGGMQCFGPVAPERDEPVFHSAWEARALALNRAMGYARLWNIDIARAAIENLDPEVYLTRSYYEKWLLRLEQLLLERGLVEADEIAAGHARRPGQPLPRKLDAANVAAALTRGSFGRPPQAPARFKAGERVRTRNINPKTHTRLPRYARGHVGTIECVRGCHVFPDAVAIGEGENPQWLYTLLFEGRQLWGEGADPNLKVSIEAFEPYLEAI